MGRAMDRDVAAFVMKQCWCGGLSNKGNLPRFSIVCPVCDGHEAIPPYSTSIEAAWAVFNTFTSRYLWYDDATDTWHCHLDSTRRTMEDCRYHAAVSGNGDETDEQLAAQVICDTALLAVQAGRQEG